MLLAIPPSLAFSVLLLFQVLLFYPCVSVGFGMFPTSAVFTWLKLALYDQSLTREISSTVASWMLTWLSATTSGIRSVEQREAGRGELHASVEVTRLSGFKAFSSVGVSGRMNWHYSILLQAWNSVGFLSCCETIQSQGPINGDNIFVLGPIQGCSKRVQLGKKEEPNLTAAVLFCFQPQLMIGTELLALAITSKFLISRVEIKVKLHRRKNE